jgi:NAD(P)-dependent dehydrogenase (short-subunit alcohol dehydrogenase family)
MAKVVLITGVSSGFGKATAEILVSKGYKVYGISRRQNNDLNTAIKTLQADVTNAVSVRQAVNSVIETEGCIDVLINNAGMGITGSIEDASPADISLQMNTNFTGYVNLIQAVLPAMRKQGGATIINTSSIGGLMGLPYQGFYSASKFAVEGLSEALRMELAPYNIKVIVIQPGDFSTNFTSNRKPSVNSNPDSAYLAQFQKTISIIEKDEKGGLPPEFLARKIARILDQKNPCNTYIIATLEQKFAVVLKRILPGSWFSKILSSHYGIKPASR